MTTPTTHPNAAPVPANPKRAYRGPKPPPRKSKSHNYHGSCRVKCVGGRACVCSNRPHVIHTCKFSDCICRDDLRGMGTGVAR